MPRNTPLFSKRHYGAIAQALKSTAPGYPDDDHQIYQWEAVVTALCQI